MKALALLELSRFWAPTPTYLQAHGWVELDLAEPSGDRSLEKEAGLPRPELSGRRLRNTLTNEGLAALEAPEPVTHEEKSHEHRTS